MILVDTHAHLDFPPFNKDRDRVIRRAFESGVQRIINVGTDLDASHRSIALAEQYPGIFAAVGIHPHDAEQAVPESMTELKGLAGHPKVVAVGETGLDFYRNYAPRDAQVAAFRVHVRLAQSVRLPLIVHVRNAYPEVFSILEEMSALEVGGVFHCFSGALKDAQRAVEMGFYVAFGGAVTFKKSSLGAIAEQLPLDRILLETDCPYIAPVPHRGKRNEPSFVRYVAEKLAGGGRSLSEIAAQTTSNAEALFRLI